jgi:protein-S-isoprenylcysteine O-methyltransferase Ste14
VAYLVLVAVFLAAVGGRCTYEHMKRSGRLDPRRRLVFALVFADMVVLWAAWFSLVGLDPLPLALPAAVRWLGGALTVAGGALFVAAAFTLRGLENTTVLVTSGIYAVVRHPAYLGFVLWLVGWPVLKGAGASLAVAAVGIAATLWWRRNEERALVTQFGAAYRAYQRRTRG